ncbi:hypothetical protein SBF1_4970001 [Candidatus Desulfosporosinus infrequens]|uniref:Uncharacterized protein n=1 Tax=Candidatus Desulfosporosinus infrequens TaxID=2043169 RepID=A0A2U3LGV4_9FIRM|nr:hypothetical protein SBF1_4970001 [Candidatus Desulfosporosinus infrequens]
MALGYLEIRETGFRGVQNFRSILSDEWDCMYLSACLRRAW